MATWTIRPNPKSIEAVDAVFQIMSEYSFTSLDEKAGLFSYYYRTFQSFDVLYQQVSNMVVRFGQRDHIDRIGYLMTIREKLIERLGYDLQAHLAWLDTPHNDLRGMTPRAMMSTLNYFDLMRVAQVIEKPVA